MNEKTTIVYVKPLFYLYWAGWKARKHNRPISSAKVIPTLLPHWEQGWKDKDLLLRN